MMPNGSQAEFELGRIELGDAVIGAMLGESTLLFLGEKEAAKILAFFFRLDREAKR